MINVLTSIKVPRRNRELLPESLHGAYDSLEKGMLSFHDSIPLPGDPQMIENNYQFLWSAVLLDHPEIFYVGRQFELLKSWNLEIRPHYTISQKEVGTTSADLMREIRRVDKALAVTRDPYRIILSVHDWLASTVVYDEDSPRAFDVTGALLDHKAVCQGISAAASLMLSYAGLSCATCFGKLRQKNDSWHAWNVIDFNGRLGHMDITNDLVSLHRHVSHGHLLMTESVAHRLLSWQGKVDKPIDFDYYRATGTFAHNMNEFVKIAKNMISAGMDDGEIKIPMCYMNEIEGVLPKVFAGFGIEYVYDPELEIFTFKIQ